ncbi:iron-sulfur cluster assembly scaffold protein [Sphingomonas edaphi]|uniref:Iron-sulfur cluster assembly scaffold protein n=1 Tax=Sphingomonas edaphi TaxID=2315689 RepID=A0A418Q1J9_9SPHN|nr:iron-sulfur cluster assembly scaffold protein [Sphingomonas edaphi]RIX31906.1 iron-sulfur cluster assembly scaffold protein [Sphingomonas edaphi]
MSEPLYTRDILRLAASIPKMVRFAELEAATERRSPTCGSRARVAVELNGDGRIIGLRQAVEACAFGQAAAALMGRSAAGRSRGEVAVAVAGIENWLAGDDGSVDAWPGLEVLAPARARRARHGAILLPFRTLLAAMEEGR